MGPRHVQGGVPAHLQVAGGSEPGSLRPGMAEQSQRDQPAEQLAELGTVEAQLQQDHPEPLGRECTAVASQHG